MSRIVIIGGSHPTAVGNSLHHACKLHEEVDALYVNADEAWRGPRLWRALLWRLAQKRPPRLQAFNRQVLVACHQHQAQIVLCAGNLQLTEATVRKLQLAGAKTAIYLTDDPWNPSHYSRRFMRALPLHDWRLTTRKANIDQLERMRAGRTAYLPFGYDPRYFHPIAPIDSPPAPKCEVFFAGGADEDRIKTMTALLDAGIDLHLYGDLWDRWPAARKACHGYAAPEDLARLISESVLCLCLVRRANRDGTCMRSYELPPVGACMLVENTQEHRDLFGADGEAVRYFTDDASLVEIVHNLLQKPHEQLSLRRRAHALITEGGHAYSDRLEQILRLASSP